jgi:hypothetical protein
MILKEFLRKKKIYRKFKTRWLKHNIDSVPRMRMGRHTRNLVFEVYLEDRATDKDAIMDAFRWTRDINLNMPDQYDFWRVIDNQWRDHLIMIADYGDDIDMED